jgi:hypothetical protein
LPARRQNWQLKRSKDLSTDSGPAASAGAQTEHQQQHAQAAVLHVPGLTCKLVRTAKIGGCTSIRTVNAEQELLWQSCCLLVVK